MKIRNWKRKVVKALVAGGAVFVAGPNLSNADETLVFEGNGLGNNIDLLGSGYGNALATTPNVNIDWTTAGWDNYLTWDGRGVVGQLDYNSETVPDQIDANFNADAGFAVFIRSFDLDEFGGGGDTVNNWSLVGTGFSGTFDQRNTANDPGDVGGRNTIVTGMTAATAVTGSLTLRFTRISGATSYIAVDNIVFGQVSAIPEPASASLLGLGLGAMLLRRRKA